MKYILLLSLCLCCILLWSQKTFSVLPDLGGVRGQCLLNGIVPDSMGIFTIGTLVTEEDSTGRKQIVKMQINRFDYDGNLLKSQILTDSVFEKIFIFSNDPLIKINDSLYILQMGLNISPQNGSDVVLLMIDIKNLKIISVNKIPQPDPGDLDFVSVSKSGIVSDRFRMIFQHSKGLDITYYVYEFDLKLNIKKISKIPKLGTLTPYYWVSSDSENNIECVGQISEFRKNEPTRKGNLFYLKLDSNMQVLKRKDLIGNFNIKIAIADNQSTFRDTDGSFVISAFDWVIGDNFSFGKPLTLRMSPEFDTVYWIRPMYDHYEDTVYINQWTSYGDKMSDGSGYVTCGDIHDYRFEGNVNYGLIYKVSERGDSLWTRRYLPIGWDSLRTYGMAFHQIRCTPYNTMVVAGGVGDSQSNTARAWLLHLDTDGCLVPGCGKVVRLEDVYQRRETAFDIYPNPLLTDRLAILCRAALNQEMDLNIVNLDGQRVLHSRFQATEGVHYIADIPSHLPHGTYIVSISDILGRQWYNTKLIRQ